MATAKKVFFKPLLSLLLADLGASVFVFYFLQCSLGSDFMLMFRFPE
jgi:hypothetical protein